MATRTKILLTIMSVLMVIGLGTVGVFAATNVSLSTTGGEIAFNATNVYVDIMGAVSRHNEIIDSYTDKNYETLTGKSGSLKAWNIADIELTEDDSYATYELRITNKGTKNIEAVLFDESSAASRPGLDMTIEYGYSASALKLYNPGIITIEPEQTVFFVIHVELNSFNKEITDCFVRFRIDIANAIA